MAWLDPNWQYRQIYKIKNDSGIAYSSVLVKLIVRNKHFFENVNSDGSDIRIADESGNLFDFKKEVFDYTNEFAKLTVLIPNVPTGESYFYIYYGNPSAGDVSNNSLGAPDVVNFLIFRDGGWQNRDNPNEEYLGYWFGENERGVSKVFIRSRNGSFYIYYGGGNTNRSDKGVFDIFLDKVSQFDSGAENGWSDVSRPSNAGWSYNRNGNEVLRQLESARGYYRFISFTLPFRVEGYSWILRGDISRGCGTGGAISIGFSDGYLHGVGAEEYYGHRYREYVNGGRTGDEADLSVGGYYERYVGEMVLESSGNDWNISEDVWYYDGTENATFSETISGKTLDKIGFARYTDTCTTYLYFDNLRFYRKIEYSVTIGAEESGSWSVNGETYTHRRKITVDSVEDNAIIEVDSSYFNDELNLDIVFITAITHTIEKNGNARIKVGKEIGKDGTARILIEGDLAYDGIARIKVGSELNKDGNADIKVTGFELSKDGSGWLKKIWRIEKDGNADIKVTGLSVDKNGTARVAYRSTLDKGGNAYVKVHKYVVKDGSANIRVEGIRLDKQANARILIEGDLAYDGIARIKVGSELNKEGVARIRMTFEFDKDGVARVKVGGRMIKSGIGRIVYKRELSKDGVASVAYRNEFSRSGNAYIKVPGKVIKDGNASVRFAGLQVKKDGNAKVVFEGIYPEEAGIWMVR